MAVKRRTKASPATQEGVTPSTTPAKTDLPSKSKPKSPSRKPRPAEDTGVIQAWGYGYLTLTITLAIICGVLHRSHVSLLFENDRRFSHLSDLERELSFRTEMGFYYSYYKTLIEAPTFLSGLHEILHDNVTEYPSTINTLQRFNLYPEVILGGMYRVFRQVTNSWKISTTSCWQVNRGEGLEPVLSCEGIGVASYFYVENVFALAGFMMFIFFIFGTYLSQSIWGGVLAVVSYFYNHSESTRVMWTPPLRESFAFPFIQVEMLLIIYIIRRKNLTFKHSLLIALAAVFVLVPWQFSQFSLTTQLASIFAAYVLQFINAHTMKVILSGLLLGFSASFLLLFGNLMLLTSFFFPTLLTVYMVVSLEPFINRARFRLLIWIIQAVLWLSGTLILKVSLAKILSVTDDAHIYDILRTKFTDYKTFHTMLYVCAPEFDFIETECLWKLLKTLLTPSVVVAVLCIVFQLLKREYLSWKTASASEDSADAMSSSGDATKHAHCQSFVRQDGEMVYMIFQLLAFTVMAMLIMRLKLFWTPHLCLMTSLLASKQFWRWEGRRVCQYSIMALQVGLHTMKGGSATLLLIPFFGFGGDRWRHWSLMVLLLGLMSVQGYANLQQQWQIMGEYSNYPQEEAMTWINKHTAKDAVFGGPMPTMATVKLTTGRPIINHPHYEDQGLRRRTELVYTLYSRKPVREVHANLVNLSMDYAIIEKQWCIGRSKSGCGMAELYDISDIKNRNKDPACQRIASYPSRYSQYFKEVFRNDNYLIIKILK